LFAYDGNLKEYECVVVPALREVFLFVVPTKYEDLKKSDEMVYVYKTHERD
jgi:hypothetical protein